MSWFETAGRQERLQLVAAIYCAAAEEGRPQARAVADALGIPYSTAGYSIAQAKVANLIPADTVRVNVKAAAVAATLGVSYKALVDAVREHAGGDLRLSDAAISNQSIDISFNCDVDSKALTQAMLRRLPGLPGSAA